MLIPRPTPNPGPALLHWEHSCRNTGLPLRRRRAWVAKGAPLAPRSPALLPQRGPAPPVPRFPLPPLPSSARPLTLKTSAGGPAPNSHTNKTLSLWVGTMKEINSAMVKPLRMRKQLPGNLNPNQKGRDQTKGAGPDKRGGADPDPQDFLKTSNKATI